MTVRADIPMVARGNDGSVDEMSMPVVFRPEDNPVGEVAVIKALTQLGFAPEHRMDD